jgi:hypothetical protein
MNLETPAHGGSVGQPFAVSGWAIDRGAPSGTGVDAVHVYAYPNPGSGQAPIFLGAHYGSARSDVGAAFGSRFSNSGFTVVADYLRPGPYQINAFARSTLTGAWNTRAAVITVANGPLMSIEQPLSGGTVEQPFQAAPSGTGVSGLQVWAYPNPGSGQSPLFAGAPTYGASRADVGAAYGSRFTNSGYNLQVRGLAPGLYQFSVHSRSTATNTYNTWRSVTLTVRNAPRMSLDSPGNGPVTRPFGISGWALDLAAASGTGVDAIQAWAYPVSGQPPVFVGSPSYGGSRTDVGAVFGGQFVSTGFQLSVSSLAPGTYDLAVFARSTLSGGWDVWRVVRITVQ